MRLIEAHAGKLLTLDSNTHAAGGVGRAFSSGVAELDAIAPGGGFARGAIHELLTDPGEGKSLFFAMLLAAGAAMREGMEGGSQPALLPLCPSVPLSLSPSSASPPPHSTGIIIWCDPGAELYPPALAAYGFPLDRLYLLRPRIPDPKGKNLIWAIAECLRCKGVSAVVAAPAGLSRIEARRLQLAAEAGGGTGIFLRHPGRHGAHHASATRWLIRPAPGERTKQRWTIQLLHGHGGQVGHILCLEHCRETNHLHPFDPVADRQALPKRGVARAS